jgi:hypothetical protein
MTQKWKVSFEVPAEKLSDVLAPLSASVGNFDLSPIVKVPFERNVPRAPAVKRAKGKRQPRGEAYIALLRMMQESDTGTITHEQAKKYYTDHGMSPGALYSRWRFLRDKGYAKIVGDKATITDAGRKEIA